MDDIFPQHEMTAEDEDERDRVADMMVRAKTRETVQSAKAAARDFLRRFPGDYKILSAGSGLHRMGQAIELMEQHKAASEKEQSTLDV